MSWEDLLKNFSEFIICEINDPTNMELAKEPELILGKIETNICGGTMDSHIYPIKVEEASRFAFTVTMNNPSKDGTYGTTRIILVKEQE